MIEVVKHELSVPFESQLGRSVTAMCPFFDRTNGPHFDIGLESTRGGRGVERLARMLGEESREVIFVMGRVGSGDKFSEPVPFGPLVIHSHHFEYTYLDSSHCPQQQWRDKANKESNE